MPRRLTVAALVVLLVAVVAVAGVVGVRWWRDRDRTMLEQATAYAPSDAERLSWTDWSAVRHRLGTRLDQRSSGADVQSFLDQGFDRDLTSASALVQSAPVLQERFGFSPATATWELFSQSTQGAVVIVKLPGKADVSRVADDLARVGFQRPRTDRGVWIGGDTLLPAIGADLTPELQYVALDADDGLVLTSDQADYLATVMEHLGGDDLPGDMKQVVAGSGDPLSALVYDGPRVCSALAMSHAAEDDQATAQRLIGDAGEVNPMTAYAMSVQPSGHVRVVMSFEDHDQAKTNAVTRGRLAVGPAPGQGGSFTDRFRLASASADGDLVTLDLRPAPGSYVFSDLSSGPVLFATC